MEFVAAGEVIGTRHRIRRVEIASHPLLPDGEYTFVDMHCVASGCDCRKTIVRVFQADRCVSLINYGWEDPEFYVRWLGSITLGLNPRSMAGSSIDPSSPDLVSREGILELFDSLMDERWTATIKNHYKLVKRSVRKQSRKSGKRRY